MKPLRHLLPGALLLLLPLRASGLALIGDTPGLGETDPLDGRPWRFVAQIGAGGSGVYLGNGFVLTANHVGVSGSVLLDGLSYNTDSQFGEHQIGGVDLKLIKLDLEHTAAPNLGTMPLLAAGENDLGVASTLIGWGVGKGGAVVDQGWAWGDADSARERWGTNVTFNQTVTVGGSPGTYLGTSFSLGGGSMEAQLTVLDSGSGLFQFTGGVWKLAGIGTAVTEHSPGQALYDNDLSTSGLQPDASAYMRIQTYRAEIQQVMSVPEPGAVSLLLLGCGWSLARRRRKGG